MLAIALLAQLEHVPADSIKTFLLIILAVLGAAGMIRNLFFPAPLAVRQPVQVQEAERYVTRDEWKRYQEDIAGRLRRIESEVGEIRQQLVGDTTRIHERIDELPLQIVTLLKNTGALK